MYSKSDLDAFHKGDKVTLVLDKEMVTEALNYMADEEIIVTDDHMKKIVQRILTQDLIGDFLERAWTIAEDVVEDSK